MVDSNAFMLLTLATPPFGAEVLEVAGAEDGAVALVRLRAVEDTTDFVADRLDVVTVVFAPTIGVDDPEAGGTGGPEPRLATGYGVVGPPVGIGATGASGLGVAEPAGIGVVWISSEVPGAAGTVDAGALQNPGVVVTVTVTVDSAGTIQSCKFRAPSVLRVLTYIRGQGA